MSGYRLQVDCGCEETHLVLVDNSGHYHGPLPCNLDLVVDIQVDPQEWRALIESQTAGIIH